MRNDLNACARGKMIAQGAHAAMMFLVARMASDAELGDAEIAWFNESAMAKVCVRVDSADEAIRN